MLFIDFEELKIKKDYGFKTFAIEVDEILTSRDGLGKVREVADRAFAALAGFETALPLNVEVYLPADENLFADEEVDDADAADFISWANVFVSSFFRAITLGENRARERRLDVPSNLKGANCMLGPLKMAINKQTRFQMVNLTIHYKSLIYVLIDTSEGGTQSEFVHSADEAPELK